MMDSTENQELVQAIAALTVSRMAYYIQRKMGMGEWFYQIIAEHQQIVPTDESGETQQPIVDAIYEQVYALIDKMETEAEAIFKQLSEKDLGDNDD